MPRFMMLYKGDATDMADLFTSEPDFTPYDALPPDRRVFDPEKAMDPLDENFDWTAVDVRVRNAAGEKVKNTADETNPKCNDCQVPRRRPSSAAVTDHPKRPALPFDGEPPGRGSQDGSPA